MNQRILSSMALLTLWAMLACNAAPRMAPQPNPETSAQQPQNQTSENSTAPTPVPPPAPEAAPTPRPKPRPVPRLIEPAKIVPPDPHSRPPVPGGNQGLVGRGRVTGGSHAVAVNLGSGAPQTATPQKDPVDKFDQYVRTSYESTSLTPVELGHQSGPAAVLAYPNIEAPDTVSAGQEIAVQVSLSDQQIAPETKILSGEQQGGEVKLQMAAGENQWTLHVNVSAPGLEFTHGSNTQEITVARDGNSTVAAFYMRPKLGPNGELPAMRDTRILATLLHDNAFVARLARPLKIVETADASVATARAVPAITAQAAPAPANPAAKRAMALNASNTSGQRTLDLSATPPTLNIIENRVGNLLRIEFFSADGQVEEDIQDAAAFHSWINAHFAQIARYGRGASREHANTSLQSGTDYLDAFGNELSDKVVPDVEKDTFAKSIAKNEIRSIQVFSDDPAVPWELVRLLNPETKQRSLPLGELVSIARWPLTGKGLVRPKQVMVASRSVVVAPHYDNAMALAGASEEVTALLKTPTFQAADGSYSAVRALAENPPPGILHFAGHGQVSQENGVPQYSILLKDGSMGPEAWAALRTSTTSAGTLYFFNACEVGESSQFMNEVDGWAPALLNGGASGYIGALWPISDNTATLFAATFYKQLAHDLSADSKSASISDVLTETRKQVFETTHDPTALAYVFYGDPRLRVTMNAP